jgi:hypothetical protein
LLAHFQFKNELKLFDDIGNRVAFSINIYQREGDAVSIAAVFNLYHPGTIERCKQHNNAADPVPAMKNNDEDWDVRGHCQRIVAITESVLGLFARLFEKPDTPAMQARLPQVHSQQILAVLQKFAAAPKRLGDLEGEYLATVMFDETYAQRDGIITRQDNPSFQPRRADEWVLSGPHFYVGNPFNKTPFSQPTSQRSYDDIDLTAVPDDFLPRAVYRPGDPNGNLTSFHAAIPEWPKPGLPGFWPVSDAEVAAYEVLLGEPLKRYGIDPFLPGAKTARQFGYFTEYEGGVSLTLMSGEEEKAPRLWGRKPPSGSPQRRASRRHRSGHSAPRRER